MGGNVAFKGCRIGQSLRYRFSAASWTGISYTYPLVHVHWVRYVACRVDGRFRRDGQCREWNSRDADGCSDHTAATQSNYLALCLLSSFFISFLRFIHAPCQHTHTQTTKTERRTRPDEPTGLFDILQSWPSLAGKATSRSLYDVGRSTLEVRVPHSRPENQT